MTATTAASLHMRLARASARRDAADAETRELVIELARRPGANLAAIARDAGVTRATVYAWLRNAEPGA